MLKVLASFKKRRKGPPEKEFFDTPDEEKRKEEKKARLNELKKRPHLFVIFGVIGLVLLFSLLLPRSKKEAKYPEPLPVDEGRVLMTSQSMEKAIEKSSHSIKKPQARREDLTRRERKRKYDTDIAVFVAKPKEEKLERIRERPEPFNLGLPSGTKVPALISDRVFSFNVAAPVQAILAKDFIYKEKVVIPKDSRFLGEADVVKSLDRINVRFDLLILPDGREVRVRALALSEDGAAGIQGKVDRHTDKKVLKAVGESVLSVGSLFLGGRSRDPYSLEDQLRLNVSQSLHDEARQNLRETRVEKSITVESYTPVQVILLEAV